MLITVILFVIGLAIICIGGDKFVDNAVEVAKKLGMSEIMIGATIVSIGTTLPEVLVSTTAAFEGSTAVCAGNAYGSIICNTALIAGVGQLCRPSVGVDGKSMTWNTTLFFVFGAILCALQLAVGAVPRFMGVALLAGFVVYTVGYVQIMRTKGQQEQSGEETSGSVAGPLLLMAVFALALFIGARLLVNNGILIAQAVGVPERVIAVTFIALGTSLPELVTTISALVKGRSSLGIGNVLGANLLNLLLVIGIPATITNGISIERSTAVLDTPFALFVMLILVVPFLIKKRGSRIQGALLVAIYAAYCAYNFM